MEDPKDHRPVRFRYLGAFFVKPYWRKGLRNSDKIGLPTLSQENIWARVPEQKFNKTYINLKKGFVSDIGEGNTPYFTSLDGTVTCPVTDIKFWGPDS